MSHMKSGKTSKFKTDCHCDGCGKKLPKAARKIEGVKDVKFDWNICQLTVTGNADLNTVLKRLKKTRKTVESWPENKNKVQNQNPPLVVHDSNVRPPEYVKGVETDPWPHPTAGVTSPFSDEDPNACSIM